MKPLAPLDFWQAIDPALSRGAVLQRVRDLLADPVLDAVLQGLRASALERAINDRDAAAREEARAMVRACERFNQQLAGVLENEKVDTALRARAGQGAI